MEIFVNFFFYKRNLGEGKKDIKLKEKLPNGLYLSSSITLAGSCLKSLKHVFFYHYVKHLTYIFKIILYFLIYHVIDVKF